MNIEMKVSLKGFDKEIYRFIEVNDDMTIKKFCEAVIMSMNGWLEHLYSLKHRGCVYVQRLYKDNNFDMFSMGKRTLESLSLKEKDRLILEYDTGDGWEFKIQIKKIHEGYKEKNFVVLSGQGKGIIEDCGGLYGLEQFINGTVEDEMKDWYYAVFEEDELYDINDFSKEELNAYLDPIYNKKRKAKAK